MADHYTTLGLPRDADAAAIKSAYRRLAALHHPDKGGDAELFKSISLAYATLSDAEKRAYYDRTGSDAPRQRSDTEEIASLVVGAFDRALVEALSGKQSQAAPGLWASPPKGLGRTDITKLMVRLLNEDVTRGLEANAQIATEVKKMREMQRRLGFTGEEGKNIIGSMLEQRLRDADAQAAKNSATLALVEKAIKHVGLYGWEMDPDPASSAAAWWTDFPIMGETFLAQPRRSSYASISRLPIMPPGERIKMTRRRRVICTIDDNGKQVPAARGSWAVMARRADELARA